MMSYENFFDGFDDLIEFPSDNECSDGNLVSSNFPTWDEALQFYDPLFSGGSVPYEDVMPLEWFSTLDKDNTDTLHNQIRTSSPISLERNSSSTSKAVPRVPQRARSKRPEPASTESSPMKKSDKKIKIANEDACPALVRKCSHCGITKTPQWRAGPTGPKTLCNACGVRFKSGRLFPEYRPAASPTFVPALHSNSHKKVIEMRGRACS